MIAFGTSIFDPEAFRRYALPGIKAAAEPDSEVYAFAAAGTAGITMNPQVSLPAQVVRLRILDAEIARNHNLGFSLTNALKAQHIPSIDIANKSSVTLPDDRILSSIKSDLCISILRHRHMNINIPARSLLDGISAYSPLESLIHANYACYHDEICVNGYRVF